MLGFTNTHASSANGGIARSGSGLQQQDIIPTPKYQVQPRRVEPMKWIPPHEASSRRCICFPREQWNHLRRSTTGCHVLTQDKYRNLAVRQNLVCHAAEQHAANAMSAV